MSRHMSAGHLQGRVFQVGGAVKWKWAVVNTVTGESVAGDDGFDFARAVRDCCVAVTALREAWMRLSPKPKSLRRGYGE